MVVFTCGHCGESVQKPKVEKHYLTKCRNKNPNLSCMDCFKDFLGNDYESHIKCITEEERYSGKGFQAKEKKGEKKQNAWVEMLQSVLDEQKSASNNVLRIIETISKHNNTPRKKPKFINFVKNVCGHRTNPKDIDQAWEMISVKLSELATVTQNKNQNQSGKPTANGTAEKENDNDDDDNTDQNGVNESKENANIELENGRSELESTNTELEDGNDEQENETETINVKKLSKKQRKEEKKRRKYEAELQSAELPPEETEDTEVTKKGKKKKNRTESANHDDESQESKKEKKRKRQDTVNCPSESENIETNTVVLSKEKLQKKKQKCEEDEAEESICLHDQNVAKIEALDVNNGKFNWHAVIVSVLEKKGNELPFKRLQKKVLSEYSEATGCEVDDRIAEKFIKRLKSIPNVRVDKNRVLLIE